MHEPGSALTKNPLHVMRQLLNPLMSLSQCHALLMQRLRMFFSCLA